jgi:hypothetical protein
VEQQLMVCHCMLLLLAQQWVQLSMILLHPCLAVAYLQLQQKLLLVVAAVFLRQLQTPQMDSLVAHQLQAWRQHVLGVAKQLMLLQQR